MTGVPSALARASRRTAKAELHGPTPLVSPTIQSNPIQSPEVRVYGDVAILTYRENVTGSYEGKPSKYTGKVTMVYVKQKGTWRGVHYHESK